MPVDISILQRHLPYLPADLLAAVSGESDLAEVPKDTELLHEGQYVRVIPIVLEGLVSVFTRAGERELLLYYIRPAESCVMSFSAIINNDKSRIHAVTEEDSTLLLLPAASIPGWTREFPRFNDLFYRQYNLRYSELIDTIRQLLFNRMDHRILEYLQELARVKGSAVVQVRHREIAQALGTAREVVTRTLRKLETEGLVQQTEQGILILERS
jgi:CRP/FNR family transcriptional regulator